MMKSNQTKISTIQLVLLSTGGMIGSGWLFAPYYGFQTAGIGVLVSWLITSLLTLIIGFSFAEVSGLLPIVGGISRFIGVTHNKTMAFIFLGLSWLSYVVYLPLEAQSAIQYLGFWWNGLVSHSGSGEIELSKIGLFLAFAIIIGLTWFNTLFISRVARANFWVSLWKLVIPLGVALLLIFVYGKSSNVVINYKAVPLSFENILLAITTSGLAFAFTGFQNGLVLANSTENPKKALSYSIFYPIILGGIIYFCLSLAFITCLSPEKRIAFNAIAPLLGLVTLFAIHTVYVILFIDAVIAPLGTANVFTAVTGRVLYGLGKDFLPGGNILVRLNKYSAPSICLWISAIIGMGFLLPFPTWKELVNFLSSIVVFAYLAGPITLLILRHEFPDHQRHFKVKGYRIVGYLGFACCSLLIYWSGLNNLSWLSALLIVVTIGYALVSKKDSALTTLKNSWVIIVYLFGITLISYLHHTKWLAFPEDNGLIILFGFVFCKLMVLTRLPKITINTNLATLNSEIHDYDRE